MSSPDKDGNYTVSEPSGYSGTVTCTTDYGGTTKKFTFTSEPEYTNKIINCSLQLVMDVGTGVYMVMSASGVTTLPTNITFSCTVELNGTLQPGNYAKTLTPSDKSGNAPYAKKGPIILANDGTPTIKSWSVSPTTHKDTTNYINYTITGGSLSL